jgi:hypothetical protein
MVTASSSFFSRERPADHLHRLGIAAHLRDSEEPEEAQRPYRPQIQSQER